MSYDLIVIGLGGMGSAVLAHASREGRTTLGVDQFEAGHQNGASSGRSRVIRKAYFEDPAYVPMLDRAYDLWHELERATETRLLNLVGSLAVGQPSAPIIQGIDATARRYDIPLERFDRHDVARRFPGALMRESEIALLEPEGGIVYPELAVSAFQSLAARHGADMRFLTKVTALDPSKDGVAVAFSDGTRVEASRVAICAGPWSSKVLADLDMPLRVQRNVQVWFKPQSKGFESAVFPTFFVDRAEQPAPLYGMPDEGDGVKAAFHGFGRASDPDALDRDIHDEDVEPVREALNAWMQGAGGAFESGKACMYALTPDENFIVDRHPHDERIVIAGGFSGHGFKFCPVIGEIVTQLAFQGSSTQPIEFLSLDRFSKATK